MTLIEVFARALKEAGKFNRAVQAQPEAILWTDAERQWVPVVKALRASGRPILMLGEYAPEALQGPAIWLKCALAGKLDGVALDGVPVDLTQHWFYRGALFSNVPNLAFIFGYINAAFTLRADCNARYICEVLQHMRATGTRVVVAPLAPEDEPDEVEPWDFSSGYLARARHLMPKSSATRPWALMHDYLADSADFRTRPVADGVLHFGNPA